jgi:DNA topoisomerase I
VSGGRRPNSSRTRKARTLEQILALHEDAERCAIAAGLRYVSTDDPGISRIRCGRGFRYRHPDGSAVSAAERRAIEQLAIPPAWRQVWICTATDGHLRAVGEDDRGRRQYLYHDDWRTFRDELNFYRLIDFGRRLGSVRAAVATQLRRRTMDKDQVLAAMLRIIDLGGLRVGTQEYADENDSYGLSTLLNRHAKVVGGRVEFCFSAKSGRDATVTIPDAAVARVVRGLAGRPSRPLFTVDGAAITADEVNERLAELAAARLTAKDFRTWHGTRIAFSLLRKQDAAPDREQAILDAVDAASAFLGNTRAVARAHYVHPHVLRAYADGELPALVAARRPIRAAQLDADERALVPLLNTLLTKVRASAG